MINVIQFADESFETDLVSLINSAYSEASDLLHGLRKTIDIKFTDNGASDDTGVGGFTVSDKQINIAVLKDYKNKAEQRKNLRGTVLHESFHVRQGFTYNNSPFTAIESAIYEGCAVVFEKVYAQNHVIYGDYSQYTEQQLRAWLDEIRTIGTEYFENVDTWHRWAFYHQEYDEKWIIYKVGTWIIDTILKDKDLDILDLKDKSADEIIKLVQF